MDEFQTRQCSSVEALRNASLWLVATSIATAAVMVFALRVPVDPVGTDILAWIVGMALITSKVLSSRFPRIADGVGALAQAWIGGLASCVVAVLGLRLHMPLRDGSLLALDRVIGFDGAAVLAWSLQQPHWLTSVLSVSYSATVPFVCLSTLLISLIGDRVETWRAAMCFVGSVLTTCLISMVIPAKGMSAWISPELLARLPAQPVRDFWPSFEHFSDFYDGVSPTLRLDSLGAAATFPSFHTIMGLIVVTMWRKRLLMFVPVCSWLFLMLASTLPFGGHYLIDLIGGAAIWGIWFAISQRIEREAWSPFQRLGALQVAGADQPHSGIVAPAK
jgi:hypothetical protein